LAVADIAQCDPIALFGRWPRRGISPANMGLAGRPNLRARVLMVTTTNSTER